ncbi:site-specific integrase [Niabella sp. 22666]|uniref:site-specific integrase n=1 Tax=Niabella sp. 22666 TaxID=3453954 RepID=UPI003F85DB6F
MATQTFSVSFLVRKCKADKTHADIYVRITVDGQGKEFSTKEQIAISAWDRKKGRVKGNTIAVKSINEHLDNIRLAVKAHYRKLIDNEKLVTAESVRDAYQGVQTQLKGHTLKELAQYYQKIWEPKLAKGNFKNYKTTITYLELFLQKHYPSKDVYLSQVDGEFATEFEHYIRTTPIKDHDPCKGNGLGKHIQRFKRILNWAEKEIKWIKENKCKDYSCPLKRPKRRKLNFVELVKLEKKRFVNPALEYVKELFLHSCYTGFAFIDAMALTEHDFEWEADGAVWCKIYRTKSDELCAVPLLASAAAILKKYRADAKVNGRKNIFPAVSNQHVNARLKIIQEACEVYTYLTFHVARHTFAKTVALKNGIPMETVQMMMGHTKITTTQIYADVDEEKIINDMSGLEDKLNRKRDLVEKGEWQSSWQ